MAAFNLNLRLYDHFSFDLDNTLCEYNINNVYTSQYKYLITYLSTVKRYKKLTSELNLNDISFFSRGLFIDLEKGNLLKLNKNGVVERASHGTKMLTKIRISEIYGPDRKWAQFSEILANPIKIFSKYYINKIMALMDFTTCSLSLVYAKAVDSAAISSKSIFDVNTDVKEALNAMHKGNSSWSADLFQQLQKYVQTQDPTVIEWLTQLKTLGYTSLVTSSDEQCAKVVARRALGPNWKELFDFIVYSSRKPYFFTAHHTFYDAHQRYRMAFSLEGEYSGGSFDQIEKVLAEKLHREPRSIYFGDSPINDFVASPAAVAIIEESAAENLIPFFQTNKNFLTSSQWGSLFYENDVPTWFGNIVLNTKFCAPGLSYFSRSPKNLFRYNQNWSK